MSGSAAHAERDPRDGASRPIDHRAVYRAELDAESDQQSTIIVVDCGPHLHARLPSPPGAVNTRPTVRPIAVFISLADGQRAVAKFSKSRVRDKVTEGSTLMFGDALISLKHRERDG